MDENDLVITNKTRLLEKDITNKKVLILIEILFRWLG